MFHRAEAILLLIALSVTLFLPEAVSAAGYTLTQSVSAELIYESNANLAPNNEKPSSDFSLRISPVIELIKESERVRLKGAYMPTGSIYFREHNLNVITHAFNAEARADLSDNNTLTVTDALSFRKDSAGEVGAPTLQLRRANIFSNVAGLGVTHRFTPLTSIGLNVSEGFFQVQDSAGITKTWTDSAAASLSFGVTDNTSMNAGYTFTNYRFYSPAGHSSIDSHSGTLGISHHFPYSLDVMLSTGVAYMPKVSDHYVALAGVTVKKSFQASALTLDYSRGLTISTGLTSLPDETNRYAISWDSVLTQNSDISLLGTYTSHRTVPLAVVYINQYGAALTARWHLSSKTTLGCGYSFLTQVSKGTAGDDFRRNNVFVSVTYIPYEGRF